MQFKKSMFILSICALLACVSATQAGYIDNGDSTVTDNGTGLMWQQATAPGTYTWQTALAYCENLILNNDGGWTSGTPNGSGAKYGDWRLPTVKELETLADKTRYSPAIDTTYFPEATANICWSSTTIASSKSWAWGVSFDYGPLNQLQKTSTAYVRAVRAGQYGFFDNVTLWHVPDTGQLKCYNATDNITCPQPGEAFYGQDASYSINTPAYTKLASGGTPLPDNASTWAMVRDAATGLIWEEKHNPSGTYTWLSTGTGIVDFINELNTAPYGGFSDWRMPTEKELQTILDYGLTVAPYVNSTYFPATAASHYWSATPCANNSGFAWYTGFSTGSVYIYDKTFSLYARGVRAGQSASFGDLFIFKSGAGAGTVTSADGRIDCGSDCAEAYVKDTEVTLTAAAAPGSIFTGWSGGGCSGTDLCTVDMNINLAVSAIFDVATTTTTSQPTTTTSIIPSTTTTTGGGSTTTTVSSGSTTTSTGGTTTTAPVTTTAPTTTTTTVSGKQCPIIKALGDNNPNLENLRAFRDSKLAQSAIGLKVIQIYYNNADSINTALERSPALRAIARRALETIAPMVGNKQ